ncbi:phospholipase D gamma 1 [Physcomitrium patens]|uniref:phospholipase D gamma 1 n=1 Tax=Physcomitrium patens TaxID=3218 RepID=UPI000D165CB9|nr:phospholipase D gamma 1-like [Physcomitrium patens]|eukprot:XP_024400335.1 phospholipase D gamma 1-like [Physcomitrella patens]
MELALKGQTQKFRRFMIYVHAKGMIVDDEYIICGSVSINQRSMEGSRDTEIAIGTFQPRYSWDQKQGHPMGQSFILKVPESCCNNSIVQTTWLVQRSMATECYCGPSILGRVEPLYTDAGSLECVTEVNRVAEANWKQYTAEDVTDMKGHLLSYPI